MEDRPGLNPVFFGRVFPCHQIGPSVLMILTTRLPQSSWHPSDSVYPLLDHAWRSRGTTERASGCERLANFFLRASQLVPEPSERDAYMGDSESIVRENSR